MFNVKKTLLATSYMLMANLGFSQPFDKVIREEGIDRNHYSIETVPGVGYAIAGTEFNNENNDIHLFFIDLTGATLWDYVIDVSDDDRALDLVVTNDRITLTGYVSPDSKSELYVASFDLFSGAPIADFKLNSSNTIFSNKLSGGTNIVYNQEENFYIVGGFETDKLEVPLINNRALLIKLDDNLNILGTPSFVVGDLDRDNSINDIVQVENGYFITGSIGVNTCINCNGQGVLAATITNDLSLVQNLSFHSTNALHVGVSAVYDSENDVIYLMSNNTLLHSPQINIIPDASSGAAYHSSRYYLDLDTKSGAHNAAGFKLELSPWDNRNLIAAGYHKTDALDEVLRRDATPWICEFRKNGTQIISNLRWPAPSQDFSLHGGDVLSTFGDQQPYIFCQEMFSFRSDLEGIVFLSPIWTEGDNNFHLELTTTQETIATSCLTQVPIDIKEWPKPRRLEALTINEIVYEFEHPNYSPQTNFNDHNSFCDVDDQYQYLDGRSVVTTDDSRLTENAEINASLELNVSPNPSSTFVNVTVIGEKLNGHLELMNTMGQIIYTSELLTGSYYRSEIDITPFEEGIYFLR